MTTIRTAVLIPIVAHQGGWDEGLIVAGPLLVIVGLLWLAKRRAVNAESPDPPISDD